METNAFSFPVWTGPVKPDGSVNFECHCVSHLVASPCGYAFRKAITCQKAAGEEELEKGACADEFMEFVMCAVKTGCFKRRDFKLQKLHLWRIFLFLV